MYEEDVFSLYERNRNHHNNYCLSCDDKKNECNCLSRQTLYPVSIGEQGIPCRMQVKNYVKIQEECPICYEPMIHKVHTYITRCGHAFHRKCLANIFHAKWKVRPFSQVNCPLCRCSLGFPDLFQRYDHYSGTNLDILENFWLTKDFVHPYFCILGPPHYLGMKNDCETCLRYRQTGC